MTRQDEVFRMGVNDILLQTLSQLPELSDR